MEAQTPINIRLKQARRRLAALIAAGEGVSLGSLAADLDLAPPETLTLLHRVVVQDHLPVRAELDLACPDCQRRLETVMGLAAWVLAAQTFAVPCECGRLATIEPNYLDLLLVPDSAVPAKHHRAAESARQRVKSLDRESLSAMQLSFDWDLLPADDEPQA